MALVQAAGLRLSSVMRVRLMRPRAAIPLRLDGHKRAHTYIERQ